MPFAISFGHDCEAEFNAGKLNAGRFRHSKAPNHCAKFGSVLVRLLDVVRCPNVEEMKAPRTHYRKRVYVRRDGEVFVSMSGGTAARFAQVCAPGVAEYREILIRLRTSQKWSRGMLAAMLGVPISTLRRWESGERWPCGAAKKLIWLIHSLVFSPEILLEDLRNIATWGRFLSDENQADQRTELSP